MTSYEYATDSCGNTSVENLSYIINELDHIRVEIEFLANIFGNYPSYPLLELGLKYCEDEETRKKLLDKLNEYLYDEEWGIL